MKSGEESNKTEKYNEKTIHKTGKIIMKTKANTLLYGGGGIYHTPLTN
jgi:hypothetical protein